MTSENIVKNLKYNVVMYYLTYIASIFYLNNNLIRDFLTDLQSNSHSFIL